MRINTLFWAALFVLPSTLPAQSSVLETEQERFVAMVSRDTLRLRNMLGNDLIYLHSNGLRESKQQHLDAVGSGTIVYKSMTRKPDPVVRRYGKLALVTGKVLVSVTFQGRDLTILLLYTAVYKKKKGKWQLLNWQSTRLENE